MEAISGEPGAEALDVSDLICRFLLQNESLLKHSERIPELFEQSLEFKVHEKDINKFGKVPSLTACTKMMYAKFAWHRLKENDVCAQV